MKFAAAATPRSNRLRRPENLCISMKMKETGFRRVCWRSRNINDVKTGFGHLQEPRASYDGQERSQERPLFDINTPYALSHERSGISGPQRRQLIEGRRRQFNEIVGRNDGWEAARKRRQVAGEARRASASNSAFGVGEWSPGQHTDRRPVWRRRVTRSRPVAQATLQTVRLDSTRR